MSTVRRAWHWISASGSEEVTVVQKITALLVPTVCLLVLLVAYAIGGGLIFVSLESPQEQRVVEQNMRYIHTKLNEILHGIYQKRTRTVASFQAWKQHHVQREVDLLMKLLSTVRDMKQVSLPHAASRNIANAGAGPPMATTQTSHWTLPNAIFFSVALMTTIGYGNIYPMTFYGRLMVIVYCVIGIPLCFIVIANLGSIIRYGFDILRQALRSFCLERLNSPCSRYCCDYGAHHDDCAEVDPADEHERQNLRYMLAVPFLLLYLAIGAMFFQFMEVGWRFFDAFYYCFISMTTVGLGDLVPSDERVLLSSSIYIIIGLAFTSFVIEVTGHTFLHKLNYIGSTVRKLRQPIITHAATVATTIKEKTGQNEPSGLAYYTNQTARYFTWRQERRCCTSTCLDGCRGTCIRPQAKSAATCVIS